MRNRLKILFFIVAAILISCNSCGGSDDSAVIPPDTGGDNGGNSESVKFDSNHLLKWSNSKVQDRNFYLFTLIEGISDVSQLIESDPVFTQYLTTYKVRLDALSNTSNPTAQQYGDALKFKQDEINILSTRFKDIIGNSNALQNLVSDNMRPSGVFQQFSEVKDDYRVIQLAFIEAVQGINNIIDVYVAGIDPLYKDIDKVSFDVNSQAYLTQLKIQLNSVKNDNYKLFFQPFLKFALKALEINNRNEAGRYFPMEKGVNKAAYDYIKTINWGEYEYSMIVVLGDSPNSGGDLPNISIGGMNRADHGVELYNLGKAPLIAFTGGHLWPIHSIYSEAIEMKKYVMEKYHIPENRILVDPHSRHTTTNMRNIGRQIFRYAIPVDKKAIVSTSITHSEYLASNQFFLRSQSEMGHIPIKLYDRLSEFDLEFTSLIEVLHLDSSDPLDP